MSDPRVSQDMERSFETVVIYTHHSLTNNVALALGFHTFKPNTCERFHCPAISVAVCPKSFEGEIKKDIL